MKQQDDLTIPFAKALTVATQRVYQISPDLGTQLLHPANNVISQLSAAPEIFGPIRSDLKGDRRRRAIEHLLLAARAYVWAHAEGIHPEQMAIALMELEASLGTIKGVEA